MVSDPRPLSAPEPVTRQLETIFGALRGEAGGRRLALLAVAVVAVIIATAVAQVQLNAWNQPFYNAIERRDMPAFLRQLWVFFAIAGVLLLLNVSQTGLTLLIKMTLRELATKDLLASWLTDSRAARIARTGEIGENPDQRMQADTDHLTDLTTTLAVGLLQATILLVSFVGVLWVLSDAITLPIAGREIQVPGYMVWAALLYAATGSFVSWQVGRPLVRLGADRYAHEAELRVAMVRANAQADDIALGGAEADVRAGIEGELAKVMAILRRQVTARVRLTFVTAGYGWVALVVPIIVAAPGYFGGRLSFGELMMVVGAFQQVQNALGWFVANTDSIADWRATLQRVMTFRRALRELDSFEAGKAHVDRAPAPDGRLVLDDVTVANVHGTLSPEQSRVEVAPGERLLLLGRPKSGKSTLFLAMAGLWTLGSGRILTPPAGRTLFLSQRPYAPTGTLRNALNHIADGPAAEAAILVALDRVGLGHLKPQLDTPRNWDRDLALAEQERLGYARMLLRKPDWLILDGALETSEDETRALLLSILGDEMKAAAVVSIASTADPHGFYTRAIKLVCRPTRAGPALASDADCGAAVGPASGTG